MSTRQHPSGGDVVVVILMAAPFLLLLMEVVYTGFESIGQSPPAGIDILAMLLVIPVAAWQQERLRRPSRWLVATSSVAFLLFIVLLVT